MTIQTSAIMRAETEIELDNQALLEGIRLRAYELYELRGRENGHDLEDWLRAESELLGPLLKLEERSSKDAA